MRKHYGLTLLKRLTDTEPMKKNCNQSYVPEPRGIHFSNLTLYSDTYSLVSPCMSLKNNRASCPSFKHVFLSLMSDAVFIGCNEGYQIVWPGLFNSICGVLHFCELKPVPRSGFVLNDIHILPPFHDGPSAIAINITQQCKYVFQLTEGPQ